MYFSVNLFVVIVSVISWYDLIECYPSGAPDAACNDLTPHHEAAPQSSVSPFILEAHPSSANHSIQVIIKSKDNTKLRGFVIQARLATSNSSGAIGKFLKGTNYKTIDCFGGHENTITHKEGSDKKQVIVEWVAPDDHKHDDKIIFIATVVKTKQEFWTNVASQEISLEDNHHNHEKKVKTIQGSDTVKSGSSDQLVNYWLISSFVLLLLRKV